MNCHYREKKYICGNYIDIQIFPVFPVKRAKTRKGRYRPTTEIQQKLNEENAKRKLTRLVHTNFTESDYMITLTYRDELLPDEEETAKKDIQNFFRRAKRLYKRSDIMLKYIWTMEKSPTTGRIHFHVFMSGGVDRTELEKLWGKGYANTRALQFTEKGLEGLITYSIKEKLLFKRWSASRNIRQPIERENNNRISNKKAVQLFEVSEINEAFKLCYPEYEKHLSDYEIADIEARKNEYNGRYYFSLRLYNKDMFCNGKRKRNYPRPCNSRILELCTSEPSDSERAEKKNKS